MTLKTCVASSDMWRSVALGFVLAGVLAGCSLGGGSGAGSAIGTYGQNGTFSPQKRFTGRGASLFDYAYAHCYTLAKRAATAQPFGSGPEIYPLTRGIPLVAIGFLKPHGAAQMKAVTWGCAAAMVTAFSDAHSDKTALLCEENRPVLPPDVPACKSQ
jgi:hypothetical protein